MTTLKGVNVLLAKRHEIKNLGEIKTIIDRQYTSDISIKTMKINRSAFIWYLAIEKWLMNCNVNVIPMKAWLAIEIIEADNYEKTDLQKYQRLIGKSMYHAC